MTVTDLRARFEAAVTTLPLVAILRGVAPVDAEAVAVDLYRAGFRLIEVPLNSPQPFDSIARIRKTVPADCLVGAGTVLQIEDVARLAASGGEIVVMPHSDPTVIRAAKNAGLLCLPGVATPTEAFAALDAGADALKLFPAEMIAPPAVKAMRAVLPRHTLLFPVGGILPDSMAAYVSAGANGFGLGSALYAAGQTDEQVGERARRFVAAWRALATD